MVRLYNSILKRNELLCNNSARRKLKCMCVKATNLKRVHAILFQLHGILEKLKLSR